MRKYSFEKLQVWQLSRAFTADMYRLTKSFPTDEKFGLVSQIRRSASSVPANLAEGSARVSGKEKARFTEVAFGSLIETLNHLIIASDLGYINADVIDTMRPKIEEISNKLNALRRSQLKSK